MICAPVRSIIPSLKLGDYLSVHAHKSCSISHLSNSADCFGFNGPLRQYFSLYRTVSKRKGERGKDS